MFVTVYLFLLPNHTITFASSVQTLHFITKLLDLKHFMLNFAALVNKNLVKYKQRLNNTLVKYQQKLINNSSGKIITETNK